MVIVVVLKLSKPFLKLYAEERVRRVGQHMHTIVSRAVLDKVLKVSLLSNKEISSSELIKIMQVDI